MSINKYVDNIYSTFLLIKIFILQEILSLPMKRMPMPLNFIGKSGIRQRVILSSTISRIANRSIYSFDVDRFYRRHIFVLFVNMDIC